MALGRAKQQSFTTLPLKPNVQKNKAHTTEYLLIQQSLGMMRPWEFAGGAFLNSTLQPDQQGQTSSTYSSSRGRNPRTASIIQAHQQAPTPLIRTAKEKD